MEFEDFKEIYGFWSVNKYIDDAKFSHTTFTDYSVQGDYEWNNRYKKPTYSLFKVEVKKSGFHTFAISQFGNRLLKRKADYKYANVIAYLVK